MATHPAARGQVEDLLQEEETETRCELSLEIFAEALDSLLRGDRSDLDGFVTLLGKQTEVEGKKVTVHCHSICCNQNGARIGDFARFIAAHIVDYAIPRSELAHAKELDQKYNTDRYSNELRLKAQQLFTDQPKSGEGGELLLYLLLQTYLRIPQLLCKMPLKTSGQMHVHGVDGIHGTVDPINGNLVLYWGESKLYKSAISAAKKSLEGLDKYLSDTGGSNSPLQRDLFLLRDNLDLDSKDVERAILGFLDPTTYENNRIEYRGAALVGFDSTLYPCMPNEKPYAAVQEAMLAELPSWIDLVRKQLRAIPRLTAYSLELFLIPFPSVEAFRKAFLREVK